MWTVARLWLVTLMLRRQYKVGSSGRCLLIIISDSIDRTVAVAGCTVLDPLYSIMFRLILLTSLVSESSLLNCGTTNLHEAYGLHVGCDVGHNILSMHKTVRSN